MATSGTYTFNPTLAAVLDEAWERCQKDPADIDARHIISARRSLNLLLTSELSAHQITLWTITERTVTPAESDSSFALSQGAIDVLEAVHRDTSGNDTPLLPIGRAEWMEIVDKDQEGRPDRFWVQKDGVGTGTLTFNFWQAMDDSGGSIVINELFTLEDAGDLNNEPAVPRAWFDAVCAGLAARLAEKWAPIELADRLEAKFAKALHLAEGVTIERASVVIQPDYGGMRRW